MRTLNRSKHIKSLGWIIGICLLIPVFTWASSVTVSWQGNNEADLAGYKIYYGIQSRVYSVIIDVGDVTEYPVGNLTAGVTYYFTVTAYDQSGNESDYAIEFPFVVEDTDPPLVTSALCQAVVRPKHRNRAGFPLRQFRLDFVKGYEPH